MLNNVTTSNGSQKPTPRIILALLVAIIPIIWVAKDQILESFHLSPALTTVIATSVTGLLVFVADQFGVKLPGREEKKDDSTTDEPPKS